MYTPELYDMIVAKKQFTINWFKTIFGKYIMSTLGITNKVSSIF